MATTKNKRAKTKPKSGRVEYVSAAWITKQLGIHGSSVELAWRRGDLRVDHFVLGGRDQNRPIFTRKEAEAWYREKTS